MRGPALLALGVLLLPGVARGAGQEIVLGASSDEHLWFVAQRSQPPRLELFHHAGATDGPHYSPPLTLARLPEAMAAWGSQLWLVFGPKPGALHREVFTVQVNRNPTLGGWFNTPHDHLRVLTSMEGLGRLAGFVATAEGPVALLEPSGHAAAAVIGEEGSVAAEPVLDRVTMLQLRGGGWREIGLPQAEPIRGPGLSLAAGGSNGQVLVVLSDAGAARTETRWREAGGRWSRAEVDLDAGRIRAITRIGPAIALVLDGTPRGRTAIDYLRPGGLLGLASFPTPAGRWVVAGTRDAVSLVGPGLALRRIDPLTGAVGTAELMTPQPLMTGRVLYRPLLLAVTITALMLVFLFKPGPRSSVTLAAGQAAAGVAARLGAVAIDLAVSAAVTMVVLGCSWRDLALVPLWSADLDESVPYLVTIGVTVLHSTIVELATGRTLGKSIVGTRVVARDGRRAGARAVVIRNLIKGIVLLIPVLVVIGLLNPYRQGLGDLAARTVVVRRASGPDRAGRNDR